MAQYYNPYSMVYPIYNQNYIPTPTNAPQQYMITVDGEIGAKSWQMQTMPQPNTIIPLFDSDGQHVYFKSFDAYGRMNPLRKGRIVFDDEVQVSETAAPAPSYVTHDDLNALKDSYEKQIQDLRRLIQANQNNQNSINNRGDKR